MNVISDFVLPLHYLETTRTRLALLSRKLWDYFDLIMSSQEKRTLLDVKRLIKFSVNLNDRKPVINSLKT